MEKPRKNYHHGNLRQVLIEEALKTLKMSGENEISLREIARASGVSPNAPYRHFKSKEDLLASLSAFGFEMLTAELLVLPLDGPMKRFRAMGEIFEQFAAENSALFKLMFRASSSPAPAALSEAKSRCFLAVAELVRVLMDQVTIDEKVNQAALSAWSLFFGYSILAADENHPLGISFQTVRGKEMAKLLARGLRD